MRIREHYFRVLGLSLLIGTSVRGGSAQGGWFEIETQKVEGWEYCLSMEAFNARAPAVGNLSRLE